MANQYYNQLAADIADASNEQNEAYVASGNSQSLPQRNVVNLAPSPNGFSLPANIVNNEPRIDGHDELFEQPVTSDYECPICMMVLRDPVQTPCGHRFCAACIKRHMATNARTCPIDNQELDPTQVYPDNFAKREINQMIVKCRTVRNDKNCPWKGPLLGIENHMKECEFVDVPCPKNCGKNIERKALDQHLKKDCPKRTMICQHCKTEVQQKNYKDHLERCQKVTVPCPNCNKKMLREKLIGHEKECPKAPAVCEFKPYGCKWTGLRLNLQGHLTGNAEMAAHLSMLCAALSVLLPVPNNGREKNKNGAAKSEASGSAAALEQVNRPRTGNSERNANAEARIEQLDRKLRDLMIRIERQLADSESTVTNVKSSLSELEARMCNGIYLWRIVGYSRHLENARSGVMTALHSPPFYTSFYGYKLCLRINPNGVDTGFGSHVSLFIHMMQSGWDDVLEWPFSGRISLSILDQSDDGDYKRHISETLVTRPNLLAFQRPTTARNHKGYGYVEFAHLETLQERQYIKKDTLLIRVHVFV